MRKTEFMDRLPGMSSSELDKLETELRTEISFHNKGRFQLTRDTDPSKVRELRRNLTRVLTVKKERM